MSSVPPPPGSPPPPPPPPGYGAPPPGPPGPYGAPPSPYGVEEKPRRPSAAVGGWLLVAGGAIALIGAFLPWVSGARGGSLNGFDDFLTSDLSIIESPGIAGVLGGLIGIGLGIPLVVAGRLLPVAIIAVVFAALGAIVGIGLVAIAGDTADWSGGDLGIGAIAQPVGPVVALAGSIVALAKRR